MYFSRNGNMFNERFPDDPITRTNLKENRSFAFFLLKKIKLHNQNYNNEITEIPPHALLV